MEDVHSESSEDFHRRRESHRRALSHSQGRGRVTGEAESLPQWARSGKSSMPLTWVFLFDTKKARRGAVARVALMGCTSTQEDMCCSVMRPPTLGAYNH